MIRAALIGIAAIALLPNLAHAQSSTLNNEAVCSSPGYGQDPRCVGSPGFRGWNDGAMQQRLVFAPRQAPRRR